MVEGCAKGFISADRSIYEEISTYEVLTELYEKRSTFRPTYILVYGSIREKHTCVNLTEVFLMLGLRTQSFTVSQIVFKFILSKVVKH